MEPGRRVLVASDAVGSASGLPLVSTPLANRAGIVLRQSPQAARFHTAGVIRGRRSMSAISPPMLEDLPLGA
jgi:hypothetical protein